MMYKFLSWDTFREICRDDALNWYHSGYTAAELTPADIINEIPAEYWEDVEYAPDDTHRSFTAQEIAEATIEVLAQIEQL